MGIDLYTMLDFFCSNFLTTRSPALPATKTLSYDAIHAGEHIFKVEGHSLIKDNNTCVTSEPFSVGGYDWTIVYYPKGDARIIDGQFTCVFVKLLNAGEDEVTASYSFSLLDPASPTTTESNKYIGCSEFSSSQVGWGIGKFSSIANLAASGCLKDDCLVIKCTVEIVTTKTMNDHEDDVGDNSVVVPPSTLSEVLRNLLDSELKTDTTMKIGWFKRFHVHGCVLAAQSPVFKAQLCGSLMESKQSSIRIHGIDAEVFEVLLHYMYTDSLSGFMEETTEDAIGMVRHLLVAADRYAIGRLKLICESKLSKVIDVNTVGLTLDLAEQHNCEQLKACCLEYIVRDGDRLRAIFRTDGFKQLKQNHPRVAYDILDKVVSKL